MLSHCNSSHWKHAIPTPTYTALGIRTAPLIQFIFFSIVSHQHVANNFLGFIKKKKKKRKKRKKAFEKWKQRIRLHCWSTFTAIICVFHHPTCRDYKHHLIQILQSTICLDSYCLVSLIFLPSVHGFQIIFFVSFQQPELSWTPPPCLPKKPSSFACQHEKQLSQFQTLDLIHASKTYRSHELATEITQKQSVEHATLIKYTTGIPYFSAWGFSSE